MNQSQRFALSALRVRQDHLSLAAPFVNRLASTLAAAEGSGKPRTDAATNDTSSDQQQARHAAGTDGASPLREALPLSVPAYTVWGANTNVGKTLVSVGLAHAASALKVPLSYIKPVQTGFPADSDARLVAMACGGEATTGPHAAETAAMGGQHQHQQQQAGGVASGAAPVQVSRPKCATLFAWRHAVSPHLAVRLEGRAVRDDDLVAATATHLRHHMEGLMQQQQQQQQQQQRKRGSQHGSASASSSLEGSDGAPHISALMLLETAGGVTSPAPSGRLACDVLRPLRLPALLVGDPRLGGIAATLSAYDSLVARGYDVEAVVLVGQHTAAAAAVGVVGEGAGGGGAPVVPLDNATFLREHFAASGGSGAHRLGGPPPEVVSVPACPPPPPGHDLQRDGLDPSLRAWLPASLPAFTDLLTALARRHQQRLARLAAARAAAEAQFWWPFTQHAALTHGSATLIDSRCGETWMTAAAGDAAAATEPAALVPMYDASGSWWTQAATPPLQPEIARAVSYAAGRYLHVLFPEVAHEPAVAAARALLAGPGAGWAARVFFSDDGSTAIEVALKMAFRKFLADRGELPPPSPTAAAAEQDGGSGSGSELFVLGLQGAYHGDTLGSQDCVAPSVFNGRLQSPWYRGRGLFLEPPYVGMTQGRWRILDPPAWLTSDRNGNGEDLPTWASLDEMLSGSNGSGSGPLAAVYRSYINAAIDDFEASASAMEAAALGAPAAGEQQQQQQQRRRLAACIMEPLLQGAGGMLVVEPGFQRAVAEVCRARRLPLILDEVFTGLYRTGCLTAAAALGITPDIACYGKLLTGGAAPMAATLASRDVFQAFSGPSKLFALLHGHSYTAYPIGCAAAAASMQLLADPATNPNVCAPGSRCAKSPAAPCAQPCGRLLPIWDEQTVSDLSYHPLVKRVAAVGTVLAVELGSAAAGGSPSSTGGGGYGSVGAVQVVRRLRDEHGIYARPLGPVVYVMVPPTSPRSTAAWLAGCLRKVLDVCAAEAARGGTGSAPGRAGLEESNVV